VRPRPITQFEIEARGKLIAERPRWNFEGAQKILGLKTLKEKQTCTDRLVLCFQVYTLTRLARAQETAGRRAATYQQARRWHARRQRALKLSERAIVLEGEGRSADAKRNRGQAEQLWRTTPQMPMALEQEAWRQALRTPKTIDECLSELAAVQKGRSRQGRSNDQSLRELIHRLQACAHQCARSPLSRRQEIAFVEEALVAAGVCASLVENRRRLLKLMVPAEPNPFGVKRLNRALAVRESGPLLTMKITSN
jgi:hypothetical protein